MITLPTLYKKNKDGSIQFWKVWTSVKFEVVGQLGDYLVCTQYGQVDTPRPQFTSEVVIGKNPGRKNATTPSQQAVLEAKYKWEKQVKKGYVEDLVKAAAGEDDVDGGEKPMLAKSFDDRKDKVTYPVYVQPKLDGIRCLAVITPSSVELFSRTRKRITSCPHIVAALDVLRVQAQNFPEGRFVLDGELYNHSMRVSSKEEDREIEEGTVKVPASEVNFEKIVSLVRQQEPGEGHEIIQYHIYDCVMDAPFLKRLEVARYVGNIGARCLSTVTTHIAEDEARVLELHDRMVDDGYEGCMVRVPDASYEQGRSSSLLKCKVFKDEEFAIVGVRGGKGKMADGAVFECETKWGARFEVVMKGTMEYRKQLLADPTLWQGKKLTVQFQNYSAKQVPRFPVGIAVRDYE